MARKSRARAQSSRGPHDPQQAVRDSAQKIWLAGLGAFERAKTEGPKMFETLVAQGRTMGARAAGAADQVLKGAREANAAAMGRWDKLEQVFEDRVSRSLQRLGVITGREVEELSRQVHDLNEAVRDLMKREAGGKGPGTKSTRPVKAKKRAAPRRKKAATRG
jgi:poly(hydroxyalkanoate) granule-associated protein